LEKKYTPMVETKNLIKKYYNFDIYFTLGL